MRYYRKGTIIISEDDVTVPKDIRFEDQDREIIDGGSTASLGAAEDGSMTVAVSATVTLPMGTVTTGKWFYLRSNDNPFQVSINGGALLTIPPLKPCEMWCSVTSLAITNPSATLPVRLTWGIAGV